MSELQVGQINSTDGSTAITTGADGYVSFAKTQIGGRRNLIINGAMQVAQRGTSSTGVTGFGYNGPDRFKNIISSAGTFTVSQSTESPGGYKNSFKQECTTADASLDAANYNFLQYAMEGQDVQHILYGVSDAKTLTASFWVRSNKTGTYNAELRISGTTNFNNQQYTISSADTWEHKTITFTGSTATALSNTDNTAGLEFNFWLGAGSTYSGGTNQGDAWHTTQANRAVGNVNLADTVGNYFQITGVQLEVGSVATPFEHRSYGEELALCQRYYYRETVDDLNCFSGAAVATGGNGCRHNTPFPVTMRAVPTALEQTGTASDYGIYDLNGHNTCTSVPGFRSASVHAACTQLTSAGNLAGGDATLADASANGAYLGWSAEL